MQRDCSTKETKMTLIKIAALSSVLMAAALAGCSSNYSMAKQEVRASSEDYEPLNTDYTPNYMASTSIGQVMTTPQGATVYTFDQDQLGKSTCYARCAAEWPPMIAGVGARPYGRMSLVSRDDGQQQWAYDGKPLYTYAEDSMHGDVKGENVENVWHVVK
jgi:predicted lipoprotein with Yx(FWY)xxD motif